MAVLCETAVTLFLPICSATAAVQITDSGAAAVLNYTVGLM